MHEPYNFSSKIRKKNVISNQKYALQERIICIVHYCLRLHISMLVVILVMSLAGDGEDA